MSIQAIKGRLQDPEALAAHARTDVELLLAVAEAAKALTDAGCWGHSHHSAERCRAGALADALAALEAGA